VERLWTWWKVAEVYGPFIGQGTAGGGRSRINRRWLAGASMGRQF
jgi:hypothetical protein